MEIPPSVAGSCVTPPFFEALAARPIEHNVPEGLRVALMHMLVSEPKTRYVEAADMARMMCSCRELYVLMYHDRYWLRLLGFALPKVPPTLSVYRLHRVLLAAQQNADWKRRLLTSAVPEGDAAAALTAVRVCMSDAESLQFWTDHCASLLSLRNFPTGPQASELAAALSIAVQKGATWGGLVDLAAALPAPNKVSAVVLAVQAVGAWSDAGERWNVRALAPLLPRVKSVLWLAGMWKGVHVDALEEKKWTLSRRAVPQRLRRAIVHALAALDWMQLSDAFAYAGLAKALFRSIHVAEVVRRELEKAEKGATAGGDDALCEGLRRVFLLQALLRRRCYPDSAKHFDEWRCEVGEPLQRVCRSQFFQLPAERAEQWVAGEWCADLAGRPVPRPVKRTLPAVLAQDGCRTETWARLFAQGHVTPMQAASCVRSLLLLDYPVAEVERVLARDVPLLKLLRLRQLLLGQFTPQCVQHVRQHTKDGKAQLPPWGFKDKLGNVKVLEPRRCVGEDFGSEAVDAYMAMLRRLAAPLMDAPLVPHLDRARAVAHITHTPELANVIRAGLPPSIPPYTKTSLWRNEHVSLGQLQGAGGRRVGSRIIAGINWCEPAAGGQSIDLDLSVGVFSADGELLDQCTFCNLSCDGCQHSGDWTQAPYPRGARESVSVDLEKLHPQWHSIALIVYSYTGQSMDDLHDASVFVADPTARGTGPGGMAIFTAARLRGSGTVNLIGFITRSVAGEPGDRPTLYCGDRRLPSRCQSLGSGTAAEIHKEIARMRMVTEMRRPPSMRLSGVAAAYASMFADTVSVSHGGGVDQLTRREDEGRLEFFERIEEALLTWRTVDVPELAPRAPDGRRVLVLAGELTTPEEIANANARSISEGALTIVNLRGLAPTTERVRIQEGEALCVHGADVLDLLRDAVASSAVASS